MFDTGFAGSYSNGLGASDGGRGCHGFIIEARIRLGGRHRPVLARFKDKGTGKDMLSR